MEGKCTVMQKNLRLEFLPVPHHGKIALDLFSPHLWLVTGRYGVRAQVCINQYDNSHDSYDVFKAKSCVD